MCTLTTAIHFYPLLRGSQRAASQPGRLRRHHHHCHAKAKASISLHVLKGLEATAQQVVWECELALSLCCFLALLVTDHGSCLSHNIIITPRKMSLCTHKHTYIHTHTHTCLLTMLLGEESLVLCSKTMLGPREEERDRSREAVTSLSEYE